MSRSYKKHASGGICTGSNTQYYRERNKSTRNKNKHILRNTLKKYELDDIDGFEFIENKRNPKPIIRPTRLAAVTGIPSKATINTVNTQ